MRQIPFLLLSATVSVAFHNEISQAGGKDDTVVLDYLNPGQERLVSEAISKNPKLRSLIIECSVGGDWMRDLAKCTSIERLDLGAVQVTDGDVEILKDLKSLKRVEVRGPTRLSSKGTKLITKAPSIEELFLSHVPMDSASYDAISQIQNLRKFKLITLEIRNSDLQRLGASKSIKAMEISAGESDDIDWGFLGKLREIESISLAYFSNTTMVLSQLPQMPKLRELKFYSMKIDSPSFNALGRQESLRKLRLGKTAIDQWIIDGMGACKLLEILEVRSPGQSQAPLSWEPLGKLRNLKEVIFTAVPISDAGIEFLRKCPDIRKIGFSYCRKLTDKGTRRIVELCPFVEDIDFDGVTMTESTFKSICQLECLKEFSFRNTQIDQAVVDREAKARPRLKLHR